MTTAELFATEVDYDDDTHTYRLHGRVVPSVTQALSCCTDFSAVDPDVMEAAQAFGQNVHDAAELHLKGTLAMDYLGPELLGCIEALDRLQADTGFQALHLETLIWSVRHNFAGRLDCIAILPDGQIILIDWKTGQSMPRVTGPQTAGYKLGMRECMPDIKIDQRWCVRLFSDGTYRRTILDNPVDELIFKSALNVWGFNNRVNY